MTVHKEVFERHEVKLHFFRVSSGDIGILEFEINSRLFGGKPFKKNNQQG